MTAGSRPTLVRAEPGVTRVGWIGTGVMGASMCGHLLDAGYDVSVTSRTRSKAEPLVERGATWADTAAAVALHADVVFTMVGYPSEVEEILLGDDGAIAQLAAGSIVVDMTSSRPALAVAIARTAAERGIHALDAPVSGGDVGARAGTLSIMVGGDEDAFDAVEPCFDLMGKTVVLQGPAGSGQHTKLVNQTLVAGNIVAVCEALLYAQRAGLDVTTVLESVSSGAAASWALSNLAPRIVVGDLAPGFFVDHFVKDMGIALDEAARMRIALPGLALARQLYVSLQAQGHGRDGTQALMLALEAMSPRSPQA
jgi:3-hydroxyisobutyrate dehydrogenase